MLSSHYWEFSLWEQTRASLTSMASSAHSVLNCSSKGSHTLHCAAWGCITSCSDLGTSCNCQTHLQSSNPAVCYHWCTGISSGYYQILTPPPPQLSLFLLFHIKPTLFIISLFAFFEALRSLKILTTCKVVCDMLKWVHVWGLKKGEEGGEDWVRIYLIHA